MILMNERLIHTYIERINNKMYCQKWTKKASSFY